LTSEPALTILWRFFPFLLSALPMKRTRNSAADDRREKINGRAQEDGNFVMHWKAKKTDVLDSTAGIYAKF
jgi:hypothetical protein